jgi:hypothetical protein
MLGNDSVGAIEVPPKYGVHLLGIELTAERGEAAEIGEQHGHLPPLTLRRTQGLRLRQWLLVQPRHGVEQEASVSDGADPQIPQVVGGQPRENMTVNGVLTKRRLVPLHS